MQSRVIRHSLCCLALACAVTAIPSPSRAVEAITVAVVDFDYIDPSGGVMKQERDPAERLRTMVQQVRDGLSQSGRYRVVPLECGAAPCSAGRTDPAELLA